jgi:zinc D-Ala-D-Ala dipeptidase
MIDAVRNQYKIVQPYQIRCIYLAIFLLTFLSANCQDTALNQYGLWVIKNVETLRKSTVNNNGKIMIDVKKALPSIQLDLRYGTKNNFTKAALYPSLRTTYLRKAAIDSLVVVQKQLKALGLGLKIFDAYRPYSITEKMWEPIKDSRYVADPKYGSGHNRGVSVDLTIINLSNKQELGMGTGFDNFSDTAHLTFMQLPEEVLQNRLLLKRIMEQHGFIALETEWWHYYLPNAKQFELLDIPFDKLAAKPKQKKRR